MNAAEYLLKNIDLHYLTASRNDNFKRLYEIYFGIYIFIPFRMLA